jgi:hypothetical protein
VTAVPCGRSEDGQPWELQLAGDQDFPFPPARVLALGPPPSLIKGRETMRVHRFSCRALLFLITARFHLLTISLSAVVILAHSGPRAISLFNHFGSRPFAPAVLSYWQYDLFCSRGLRGCLILSIHRYFSLGISRSWQHWVFPVQLVHRKHIEMLLSRSFHIRRTW